MALTPPAQPLVARDAVLGTRGLTTGPMPDGDRHAEIAFDLLAHRLVVTTSDGGGACSSCATAPRAPDVYADLFAALRELGVRAEIHPEPFDLGDSPPFAQDTIHDAYDAGAVERFWQRPGVDGARAHRLRGRFTGKASPVHLCSGTPSTSPRALLRPRAPGIRARTP
jgi:hypothetical protein